MGITRGIRIGAFCILSLLIANDAGTRAAWAQISNPTSPIQLIPRTKEERERRYQNEHRISLSMHVTDGSGKAVTGLTAKDFVVLDNQTPQKINRFREVDAKAFTVKTRVIVVLDGVNGDESAFAHVKKGLDQYLGEDKGPLPVPLSLFFFSSARTFETRGTTDRAAIASELDQIGRLAHDEDCDQPKMNQYEGVGARMLPTLQEKIDCRFDHFSKSIKALRTVLAERQSSRVRDQTILIWTGPGWPQAILSKGNYGDLLVELNTNLRRTYVTLDAVAWNDFEPFQGLKTANGTVPQTPEDVAAEAMRLPVLSEQNGGHAVARSRNFGEAISRLIDDGKNFYVLSFDGTPAAAADELHALEVKVDRAGAVVRATSSYYAQP